MWILALLLQPSSLLASVFYFVLLFFLLGGPHNLLFPISDVSPGLCLFCLVFLLLQSFISLVQSLYFIFLLGFVFSPRLSNSSPGWSLTLCSFSLGKGQLRMLPSSGYSPALGPGWGPGWRSNRLGLVVTGFPFCPDLRLVDTWTRCGAGAVCLRATIPCKCLSKQLFLSSHSELLQPQRLRVYFLQALLSEAGASRPTLSARGSISCSFALLQCLNSKQPCSEIGKGLRPIFKKVPPMLSNGEIAK